MILHLCCAFKTFDPGKYTIYRDHRYYMCTKQRRFATASIQPPREIEAYISFEKKTHKNLNLNRHFFCARGKNALEIILNLISRTSESKIDANRERM